MKLYSAYLKRIFDFCLALVLLILFLPLFVLIAILIKIDSKGAVFFRQQRGGKDCEYFDILKFRSMTEKINNDDKDFDPGSSMRVTSVGKLLRKSKMDELPQLINVIYGEMSMVGPRPEVRQYIESYPERWEHILSVKPGITDPASVVFRDEEEILAASDNPEKEYLENVLPKKLDLYERYVNHITLFGDLKVIFNTVIAVIAG